jgi:hypothetical protein
VLKKKQRDGQDSIKSPRRSREKEGTASSVEEDIKIVPD